MENRHSEDQATTGGVLCVFAFVILLFFKALGIDIPWGVVTAPIWGRMIFIITVEALSLGSGRSGIR